ncbi:nuclear transport factor 2 family protein (plasmid) [Tistrella mobilis]|uniref:nuclear transport factor 2 family protein n=1 Tax=Tistrella mobilis TaxID=171437 RepID=UPI0035581B61
MPDAPLMSRLSNLAAPLVLDWIDAVNEDDFDTLRQLFTENAEVVRGDRQIRGRPSIGAWAAHEIFAMRLRLTPVDWQETGAEVAVRVAVAGDFDPAGLPDPVIILLRFTLVADGISRLVVAPVAAPPSGTAGF